MVWLLYFLLSFFFFKFVYASVDFVCSQCQPGAFVSLMGLIYYKLNRKRESLSILRILQCNIDVASRPSLIIYYIDDMTIYQHTKYKSIWGTNISTVAIVSRLLFRARSRSFISWCYASLNTNNSMTQCGWTTILFFYFLKWIYFIFF